MANKFYYDAVNKKEVIDVKGDKSLSDIKSEFGLDDSTSEISLGASEHYRIVAGVVQKYDYMQEKSDIKVAKDAAKASSLSKIKTKLKITDDDIADLKKALR